MIKDILCMYYGNGQEEANYIDFMELLLNDIKSKNSNLKIRFNL